MSGSAPGRNLWIPWTLFGVFMAFVAMAVVLSVVAIRSDPGLVAGSPAMRVAGAHVMSTALAPALNLRVVRRQGADVEVEARMLRPDGKAGLAGAVQARLQRPTDASADQAVTFTEAADGTWRAIVRLPGPGAWDVAVQARDTEGGTASASLRL